MSPDVAIITLAPVVLWVCAFVALSQGRRARGWRQSVADRMIRARRRGDAPTPASRPIEVIAADLRRLGRQYHSLQPNASFIRGEAIRGSYDRALGDYCDALAIPHLLGVLVNGLECDAERQRVERVIAAYADLPPRAA